MRLYGAAMTRTGAIYAVGMMGALPLGMISLALTTRYLEPADYGRLGILFAMASFLTIVSAIGILQGALISSYGAADDEDVAAGDGTRPDEIEFGTRAPDRVSHERRRLLGTGVLLVAAVSGVSCLLVAAAAPLLARVFLGGSEWTDSVRLMALSAWAGSIWRMSHQIYRMERRAWAWSVMQWARPAIVVVFSVIALVAGMGINGVLLATAVGTFIAVAVAIVAARRCFVFAPRKGDAGEIWTTGKRWIPLVLAGATQANVSILILALVAPAAAVGLFQVASRIAAIPSYFADGFLAAWAPMQRSPISLAATDRKGPREAAAAVFSLFFLSTLALVLLVALTSGLLIQIAAAAYHPAAALIPLLAAAYMANGAFRGVYRATAFPRRRWWYIVLHFLWLLPFSAVVALGAGLAVSYRVALAQLVAGIAVSAIMVLADRRVDNSTPFAWGRLAGATAVASGAVVFTLFVPGAQGAKALAAVVALAAFPAILLALRIVTPHDIATVRAVIGTAVPSKRRARERQAAVAELPQHEREVLLLVGPSRGDPERMSAILGVPRAVVTARLVRGLRRLSGESRVTVRDALIGEYVAHPGSTLERDTLGVHLRGMGVDPLDLHVLDAEFAAVARLSIRTQERDRAAEPAPAPPS